MAAMPSAVCARAIPRREALERALAQIPQDLAMDEKVQFRLLVEGTPRALRPAVRDEVYLMAREALANAFRHSGASSVETVLEYTPSHFRLIVRDNGCGMDPDVLQSGSRRSLGFVRDAGAFDQDRCKAQGAERAGRGHGD